MYLNVDQTLKIFIFFSYNYPTYSSTVPTTGESRGVFFITKTIFISFKTKWFLLIGMKFKLSMLTNLIDSRR
jgi:hypothetical protein